MVRMLTPLALMEQEELGVGGVGSGDLQPLLLGHVEDGGRLLSQGSQVTDLNGLLCVGLGLLHVVGVTESADEDVLLH